MRGARRAIGWACAIVVALTPALSAGPSRDSEAEEESEGPERKLDRAAWFAGRRLGPGGVMPLDGRNRALAELHRNVAKGLLRAEPEMRIPGDGWSPLGPAPILDGNLSWSGRVTSIAVHPTNANIVYAGGAQGGVWKTIDHGATWVPMTDTQPSLAIGSIAIAPSNGNVIYAGTGEANFSCDSYFGAGILRSTDGGASWTVVGFTPFGSTSVSKILVHPGNPNILWAANTSGVGGFLCSGAPGGGIYGVWRSTNAGLDWIQVLGAGQTGGSGQTHDLAADPTNPSIIYAGVYGGGIWKTTNGGTSWVKLEGGLPGAVGRAAIAVDPVAPSTVYAAFEASGTGRHQGTYKSTNAGSSWSALPIPSGACQQWTFQDACTYSGGSFGQCWYDLVIGVAPDQGVWLGGAGLWRSGTGGSSWTSVCPSSVHVDQHALAFKGPEVWLGNDGGVFTTTSGGGSWTSRNTTLALAQFYPGAALDPTSASRAIAGTQDNGVMRYDGSASWDLQVTGDGASAAISSTDPDTHWYGSTQYLRIWRTQNGGGFWVNGSFGLADAGTTNSAFIAPFTMCPNDAQVLIGGSDNVWRTDDGADFWVANSPDPLDATAPWATIMTLAFAPSTGDCDTYYAADNAGRVFRTTSGGASWDDITGNLPLVGIADITVDPQNPAIVVVGMSGFFGAKLWRTANALDPSPSWNIIAAGIPDVPVNAVLIDPDNASVYYAGTDVGIFRSLDSGASWEVFMGGHPNVAVFDLVADADTGALVSFTHGRGAFKLGTFCDDQSVCTDDRYDQVLGCLHAPVDCSDGDVCTHDACSAETGCTNVPLTCTAPDDCHLAGCDAGTGECATAPKLDGEPCDDADACTRTDSCLSGVCTGGDPVPPPAEIAGVAVDRSGTDALVTWSAAGAATWDMLRGSLGAFPVGAGGDDEICFPALAASSATDPEVPLEGTGYWYLVRGANACAGPGTYGPGRASTTCP
jgi:hypothetical protein